MGALAMRIVVICDGGMLEKARANRRCKPGANQLGETPQGQRR